MHRRHFVQGAAMAAMAAVMGLPLHQARAAATAKVSRQAPGYFRLLVGDIEVTALYDGGIMSDPQILHGAAPREIAALLEAAGYAGATGQYPTAINAFLVNTGQNLLLVDTGAGSFFGDRGGRLAASLRDCGYRPDQIDTVLLTHLHSDHAFGLVDAAGSPLFPQAMVRVQAAEAAYWLDEEAQTRLPEGNRKMLSWLRAAVAPYQAAGRFTTFAVGEAPAPGVEAVLLAGHTPGHCGYRLHSQGESILFWGDIVHCLPVQFPRPEVSIDYDRDQAAAVATRQALLGRLAAAADWVGGAHLPFPGLGHVRASGTGHVWWPAPYAPLPGT